MVWGDRPETAEALASLSAMEPAPDHVVCVAQECSEAFVSGLGLPSSSVVRLTENLGFASAANLGVERALQSGAEWVLLLNNDATADPACLGACLEEVRSEERVAVVGPAVRITDRPEVLWFAGGRHHPWLAFTRHHGLGESARRPPPSRDVDYVSGCCFLLSSRAWRELGPFREDFFLYYEDVEWCHRARRAGWRCRYLGVTLCSHALGVSSGQRGSLGLSANTAYYLARNPLRFALETPQRWLRVTRVLGILVVWGAYNAGRLRHADRSAARAYLEGTFDGWRGRMGRRRAGRSGAGAPSGPFAGGG